MQYIKNVVTLKLDRNKCTGCGMCTVVCPHEVFTMQDAKAIIKSIDSCMECGACAKNCKYDAIEVRSGVGCAAGILSGMLTNSEPTCGCSDNSSGSGCCC